MIFRRPNAFIIKHIKLIHGIILLCMAYLLIKTSNISSFYAHVAEVKTIIGTSNLANLFNTSMFIAALLAIALIVIILILLIKKQRRFLFYLISLIVMVFVLVFDVLAYNNIALMEKENIDAPIYLAFDDISTILFYVQSVFVFIYLIRTTGFDIKTFSFGEDIIGLDLTEEDGEEVEFNFEIDSNEIKTARRRKLRNIKYLYLENRFKLNLIAFLIIAITTFLTIHIINSNKEVFFEQNVELVGDNYSIVINDVYVTNLSYKGTKKNQNSFFAIMMFQIKKNFTSEYEFNSNKIYLELNDKKYYPTDSNTDLFIDFGTVYKNQKLTQEYVPYYIVYEIPYEFSTKEVYAGVASSFDYSSNKYNFYKLKINYNKISLKEEVKEYKLNEKMNIAAYGIHTNITILNADIQNKYKIQYKFNKYESVDYITPTASNNEEKTILKLKLTQEFINNEKKVDFYELLTSFGSIEYELSDAKKESKIYSRLSSTKLKEENVYYLEVSKEILEGTNRFLKIKIRDKVYKYRLEA